MNNKKLKIISYKAMGFCYVAIHGIKTKNEGNQLAKSIGRLLKIKVVIE